MKGLRTEYGRVALITCRMLRLRLWHPPCIKVRRRRLTMYISIGALILVIILLVVIF